MRGSWQTFFVGISAEQIRGSYVTIPKMNVRAKKRLTEEVCGTIIVIAGTWANTVWIQCCIQRRLYNTSSTASGPPSPQGEGTLQPITNTNFVYN